jgi:hypothetical protein
VAKKTKSLQIVERLFSKNMHKKSPYLDEKKKSHVAIFGLPDPIR